MIHEGFHIDDQVFDHFKSHGSKGLDGDGVTVVEMAHVQLA